MQSLSFALYQVVTHFRRGEACLHPDYQLLLIYHLNRQQRASCT
jgi:hypothetical protein